MPAEGMDGKHAPTPPAGGSGSAGDDPVRHAFDLWLQRSLHQLYDRVAAEPIPPELLRLIETDRARRGG